MSRSTSIARLVRTLSHLEPGQVLRRAAEPVVDVLDRRGTTISVPPSVAGWPPAFVPTDARLATAHVGATGQNITLLGTKRTMGAPASWDWAAPDASRLWRFHLNYWDWAHEVMARESGMRLLEDLFGGWLSRTRYGVGDEWEPYVVSLRLWNLCGLHQPEGSALGGDDLLRSVAQQQHYLSRRLEWDIRGNHLIKNLKALCGAAAFLGQDGRLRAELRRFRVQLMRQVLRDGGHEERSPAYHAQVLQDVVDVRDLATSCGEQQEAEYLGLVVERMGDWLRTMTVASSLPPLNDGFPVPSDVISLLSVEKGPAHEILTIQAESGYILTRVDRWTHLMDIGPLGPRYNPGHGHADSLSFISWYQGSPLLVDTGTSTYEAGERRTYERSTRAHNTVEVAGCDSSEVWGSFRVGRRANTTLGLAQVVGDRVTISASHDGYRATHGCSVERTWIGSSDRLVIVDDLRVRAGATTPTAITHFHFHPEYRWADNQAIGPAGKFEISCHDDQGAPVAVDAGTGPVAVGMDRTLDGLHLQFRWPARSTGVRTTIRAI